MAKLVLVFLVLFVAALANAKGLKLELYSQAELPSETKFNKVRVGGLSAMIYEGSTLSGVSDDRGKFGPARFYELDLKIAAGKSELTIKKEQRLSGLPQTWIMDLEGLARLPNGQLVMSSEGDLNQKPRALPRLFVTSDAGVYKSEIEIPEKFLPETTGLQTKGVENNRAFEGLSLQPGSQKLFAMNEYPIMSDQGGTDGALWLRIVEFQKTGDSFKAKAEYPYLLGRASTSGKGPEIFRGVSEVLAGDNHFLVLERGLRLTKKGPAYTASLYLVDITGAKDVSGVKNLTEGKSVSLKKELLVDFEDLLSGKAVENYEALAWGPKLPNGQKSLLVMSDDNFSSKEKTSLLIFAVKEVE